MSAAVVVFFHGGPKGGQVWLMERERIWNRMSFPIFPSVPVRVWIRPDSKPCASRAWQVDYQLVADYGRAAHYNLPEGEWNRLQAQMCER